MPYQKWIIIWIVHIAVYINLGFHKIGVCGKSSYELLFKLLDLFMQFYKLLIYAMHCFFLHGISR